MKHDPKIKAWTVFWPERVLGRVTSYTCYQVEEPAVAELLNGYVYFNRSPIGRRLIRAKHRELKCLCAAPFVEPKARFLGHELHHFSGGWFIRVAASHWTWSPACNASTFDIR